MNDGLELDLFDDRLIGFRLQRFEAYNWGTFDGQVWSVELGGENGLLTGDIGSGKSTLVDGLTTLLVAPQRISYNKAAGAEHRERTLASYVLGHYKSERSDARASAKPVALRSTQQYTVLSAVFRNQALEQSVTLAQVFWFRDQTGQPAKTYVVADRELAVERDFADFDSDVNNLRKRLRDSGAAVHDSYNAYAAEFRRRFGIEHPQALELFHQTVSMKSVGNLTDFVRTHMLEPSDVRNRITALINHFEDLTRAHDAVLTAKEQVDVLTPLVADLDEYASAQVARDQQRHLRDALRSHVVVRKLALVEQRCGRLSEEIRVQQLRRDSTAAEHAAAQSDELELQASIRSRGGDRLVQLEQQLHEAESGRDTRKRAAADYQRLCEQLDLVPARDHNELLAQHAGVTELLESAESRRASISNELSELAVAQRDIRTRLDDVEAELKSLAERDSNIDQRMIAVRTALCAALGIGTEHLPFAGELIRVTDEQWEPAAERLLHGFGLSLLVPDRHYSEVARWVDATDLRGRLVYFRVRGRGSSRGPSDERSLVHKLAVRPDTPFADWLNAEVARRFDLVCARTPEEFQQAGHAITRNGQIKAGGERHEKDDRHPLGDRRRYVLGWDNSAKRRALEDERDSLQPRAQQVVDQTRTLRAESGQLVVRSQQLAVLQDRRDFTVFDWQSEAARVQQIGSELEALRAASDVLRELNEQLAAARERQRELAGRVADIDRRLGGLESRRESDLALAEQLRREPTMSLDAATDHALARHLEAESGVKGLTVENCDAVERRVRDQLQSAIDREEKRTARAAERIIKAMGEFRSRWPLASQEMDATVASGDEYRALLTQLRTDDLPRFEENFKRQLNVNAIREVVGFRAALETAQEEIRRRVGIINDSLRDIDYQPYTYIRLEPTPTTDADVRDFRAQLRACTEDVVTGSADDQYSEAKFLQVKQIVSRFTGREGRTEEDRRWTAKVTDVRNWFTFAASERLRSDDSEHEHYSDSGGKSGGQKEKLAYTILAASLAYQFGLASGETHSRTFRFVVIDEAFGRGSDESARFGLELFKRLELQLLVVTPLQKIHIIEPYVAHVGFVHNEGGRTSKVRNLTIEAYRAEKSVAEAARAGSGLLP